ncbi:MAG: hypothetical protein HZB62_00610 [Nitrospirae bacterium]|nr:hypothetical protein [Nitrospirota bacterium]
MTFAEAIRAGFHTINRRMQLVGVQAVLMIINCISFFIVVGIPLGIAFVIFGLDLTGLVQAKDILTVLSSPSDLLAKYFGLVLMVLVAFIIYFLLKITLKLYVFGGSVGILGKSVFDSSFTFSMKQFFVEAKQLFFPYAWYFSLIGVIYFILFTLLGIGLSFIVTAAKSQNVTLGLFLGIFFTLTVLLLLLIALTVMVYGIVILFFKREGSIKAFKDACNFLWRKQDVFLLSVLFLFAYVAINFSIMMVGYPLLLIPVIGVVVSLPIELLLDYLWFALLGVVFTYYYELEIKKPETGTAKSAPDLATDSAATDEGSTSSEDTSPAQAPRQADTLPGQDEKSEG